MREYYVVSLFFSYIFLVSRHHILFESKLVIILLKSKLPDIIMQSSPHSIVKCFGWKETKSLPQLLAGKTAFSAHRLAL